MLFSCFPLGDPSALYNVILEECHSALNATFSSSIFFLSHYSLIL